MSIETGPIAPANARAGGQVDQARVPHDVIRRAPKALLHDHLDGGLRPATVIELARECGYDRLPSQNADELARWFVDAADSGSLERYLETFEHTVAVMQTADALRRVAKECAEDLAADGVVYAEVRFAPELHLTQGLTLDEVVEAASSQEWPIYPGKYIADGHSFGRALARDCRIGCALSRSWCGRF